jgi:hypothetical protein
MKACSANRFSLDARPKGWGAGGGPPLRGLITVLGPWEPPRGRSNGQPCLLVRHRAAQKALDRSPSSVGIWVASLVVGIPMRC